MKKRILLFLCLALITSFSGIQVSAYYRSQDGSWSDSIYGGLTPDSISEETVIDTEYFEATSVYTCPGFREEYDYSWKGPGSDDAAVNWNDSLEAWEVGIGNHAVWSKTQSDNNWFGRFNTSDFTRDGSDWWYVRAGVGNGCSYDVMVGWGILENWTGAGTWIKDKILAATGEITSVSEHGGDSKVRARNYCSRTFSLNDYSGSLWAVKEAWPAFENKTISYYKNVEPVTKVLVTVTGTGGASDSGDMREVLM